MAFWGCGDSWTEERIPANTTPPPPTICYYWVVQGRGHNIIRGIVITISYCQVPPGCAISTLSLGLAFLIGDTQAKKATIH